MTAVQDTLDALLRVAKETAWHEGFIAGTNAGGRWAENGGPDDDDTNPYADEETT